MIKQCEIWKAIPHFAGIYEASNLGRIRTTEGKTTIRSDGVKRVWKQRIIKQKITTTSKGRKNVMVTLYLEGKPYYYLVSRLIASTFYEDMLETDMTVNHIDGNTLNNSADNLEWLSRPDNIRYGFLHGQYTNRATKLSLSKDGETFDFMSLRSVDKFLNRYMGYTWKSINKGKNILVSHDGNKYSVIHKEESNNNGGEIND